MLSVRKKALACVTAFTLAFSLMGASALTAFADQLAVGTIGASGDDDQVALATESDPTVYDTVYGVVGTKYGDYALMMKSVTYEAQYGSIKNYEYHSTVADLVKSDGSVAIHTNNAWPDNQKYLPGAATNYQWVPFYTSWRDVQCGYMKISNKETGKMGVVALDKTEIVPCIYDALQLAPTGDMVGALFDDTNENRVAVDFLSSDGTRLNSYSFNVRNEEDYSMLGIRFTGEYIQVIADVDGDNYTYIFKSTASGYEQAGDVERIFGGNRSYTCLVKTDGKVYYVPTGGSEVSLGADKGYYSSSVYDGSVYLYAETGMVENKLTAAQLGAGSNSDSAFYPELASRPVQTLPNGTELNVRVGTNKNGDQTVQAVDKNEKAVKIGDKTLGGVDNAGAYLIYTRFNHDGSDLYWATDSKGKWGAVTAKGKTVIDFKYEAFYDAGYGDTDYAIVKESGVWKFIKVTGTNVGDTFAVGKVADTTAASTIESLYAGAGKAKRWRAAGSNALDTMSKIVDKGKFAKGGYVVLTTFDGYWDALAGAGIAGLTDAPVLMTDGKSLSKETRAQLVKLAPKTIIVCGGTAAVADSVTKAAASAAGGAKVVRCWGQTATGTAVNIFQKAKSEGFGTWSDVAFVCTNDGYWDALAAAPISYSKHMPIFLTEGKSKISNETLKALKGSVSGVYIVGGTAAIAPSVEKQLKGAGIAVYGRLWGDSAIETSEAVATFGVAQGMTAEGVGVATVNGHWDALAGAALCGSTNSVLVLAANETSHSVGPEGFLKSHSSQISDVNIFGGTAAISSATEKAILAAAK